MNRPRWWLVAPALLASAVLSVASGAEIRDKAGLFSPDAVKKAQAELDRLEKEYKVPFTIETVTALDGEPIAELTTRHAQAVGADGGYLVIAKKEAKIFGEASSDFRTYLTRARFQKVDDAFVAEFKKRDFDAGLTRGVETIGSILGDAQAEAGGSIRQATRAPNRKAGAAVPARPVPARKTSGGFSLLTLIIGAVALFFLFRIVGAIFRALSGGNRYGNGMMGGRGGYPGPGGPGYGGGGPGYGGAPAGGGGFMSSLFGGIGGAMAGNYLYDQFSGRGHGGGDPTGVATGAEAAPIEDTSPQWGGGGAEAGWGDDAGAADTAGAGGDWGGGGGGDWGGGGGDAGGDWGGGGDDNGGSW